MLALFCLRLAAGMLGCLLLLPASPRDGTDKPGISHRFYRTHFLTALGLACIAWVLADVPTSLRLVLNGLLIGSMVLAFAGSFVWSLEGAPAGRTLIVLTSLSLFAALGIDEASQAHGVGGRPSRTGWTAQESRPTEGVSPSDLAAVEAAGLASAVLLGSALTAMLMGHSYLITPSLSLVPLQRLILLLGRP